MTRIEKSECGVRFIEMSTRKCVLIVIDDRPSYYLLDEITAKEREYLTKIEGLQEEQVLEHEPGVIQAWYYVVSALDIEPVESLSTVGMPNLDECLSVNAKWVGAQVDSLAEINSLHVGNIGAVFYIDCSPVW